MKLRTKFAAVVTAAALTGAIAPQAASAGSTLNGGGSTFVANLVDICSAQYNRNSMSNPNSDVLSYSATGSGTGKTNFANNTYKWGASDSVYSTGAPSGFLYVPMVAGAIAVAYKLDGVTPAGSTVRLSNETVAKIFAGQIKMWNDPLIAADNKASVTPATKKGVKAGVTTVIKKSGTKVALTITATASGLKKFAGKKITFTKTTTAGKTTKAGTALALKSKVSQSFAYAAGDIYTVKVGTTSVAAVGVDDITVGTTLSLPAVPIKVAYRSGNSGTTNNFTKYLNATSPTIWSKPANDAFGSAFPGSVPADGTFQAASGSDGVSNYVKDNNGAITYTELSYATERASAGVKSALIKNNAGVYTAPSAASSAAFYAEAAVDESGVVAPDYALAAADAYLINAIAYALAYTANTEVNLGVKSYLTYFLGTCAPNNGAGAGYAPLAGSILTKAQAQVAKIGA